MNLKLHFNFYSDPSQVLRLWNGYTSSLYKGAQKENHYLGSLDYTLSKYTGKFGHLVNI